MHASDPLHVQPSEHITVARKVTLVGVGPGDPDYVTAKVAKEIAAADIVAGFATVLAIIEPLIVGQRIVLTYRNQEEQLAELARLHADGKRCVVCCYGDLNFSAQELIARVERHCGQVDRIAGISSVQIACAKAALAMEETLFFTLHARGDIQDAQTEIIAAATAGKRHLIILPLPWSFMPPQIATMLLQAGIAGEHPIIIYQKLTLPGESETRTTLQQLAAWPEEFSDLSIVVLPHTLNISQQKTRIIQ
jgi:cobalt-precorrin-7 (C5)-methyltransferase